jgi:hypothetical protein
LPAFGPAAALCTCGQLVHRPWRSSGLAHAPSAILAAIRAWRSGAQREVLDVNRLDDAYRELQEADRLEGVLDAAYGAFVRMLSLIEAVQDRHDELFIAFVMAGGPAAQGRFALHSAPSLSSAASARQVVGSEPLSMASRDAANAIVRLSQLLTARLSAAGAAAREYDDQAACTEAARHARVLFGLLEGSPP